ncbi:MAG TPA: hypothetical protein VFS43_18720 [Polyangiaceae bacterium]|nr:hypothetical protein [Polyangiaceae bacterium]
MFNHPTLALLTLPLALAACNDNDPSAAPASAEAVEGLTATRYRDVLEALHDRDDYEGYLSFRRRLAERFDAICGDTFCGGDHADLAPVQLTCSATNDGAIVNECLWAFGGSQGLVDGATGAVRARAASFACVVPVRARTRSLLAVMGDSADPLYEPIPGQNRAFVDSLYDCFEASAPLPEAPAGPYVDAIEGLGEGELTRYLEVRRALAERFDEICADTFCRGPYPAIAPLDLRCSVDPATGELGACVWAFAAAKTAVDRSSGAVAARQPTFACPLPARGPFVELLAALSGADDPLDAPLPGGTASVGDALAACLR